LGLLKVITFSIENRFFSLPSRYVKEIIDNDKGIMTLFYGGKALKGIMPYEGDLLSVLDTAFLLDIESKNEPFILLCKEKKDDIATGLTISSIKGIEYVEEEEIKQSTNNEAPFISGFVREERRGKVRVTAILNIEKFLKHASGKIQKVGNLIDI